MNKTNMNKTNNFPLAGVRVLEFGQIAAGPFAGSLMADLGADVVKVERPDGGDGMRSWPPLSSQEDGAPVFSENFASLNRNKRSITVDLKNSKSVTRLRELIANCDVVVENFRLGVLARLGLGFETLREANPRLVYCSISGYGQTGPYAKKGAFDVTVQAMSGLMSVTGEPDATPVKCGVPVGDFCAGLYAAYTILARLMQARETGQGGYIDCSMPGSLIGVAALQTSEFFGTGDTPQPLGSAHPRNAPYQAFMAAVAKEISRALHDLRLKGLQYDKIAGQQWEMSRIEQEAEEGIVRYLSNLYEVQNREKAFFDAIEYDSEVERQFAQDLDTNDFVRLFVKLPSWFKIDTPIGPYNPDWAFVTDRDEKLYFVRETKSSLDSEDRRNKENQKIACGKKHFETIGVDYDVVTSLSEVAL